MSSPDRPASRPGPALVVVLLTGAVHVARDNVVDVLVFLSAAALMVLLPGRDRGPRPRPRWLERPWWVAVAVVLLAVVVGTTPRTSAAAQAGLAAVGVVALAVTLRAGRGAPTAPAVVRRPWVWAVVVVAGCVLELGNFLTQADAQTGNPEHPTLSALVDPLLEGALPRAVVAAAWLVAGWWVVRTVAQRGR